MNDLGEATARRGRRRRPRSVVVLTIMAVAQALLLMFLGLGIFLLRQEPDAGSDLFTSDVVIDASVLATTGIFLLIVGVAELALVVMLGCGSEIARTWFGGLAVLQVALGVYSTVALRDFHAAAILPLVMAVLVLWLLYGSDQTREFFLA